MENEDEDREFREEGEEENGDYIGSREEEEKNEDLDQRAQDMMRQIDNEAEEEGGRGDTMENGFGGQDFNEEGPEDERAGGGYVNDKYDKEEIERIYQDYGRNEEENLSGRDEFGKVDRDYFEEDQDQYIENQSM